MESTAQYWKPVWGALERYWKPSCEKREGAGRMSGTLHLAQALSNRGRRGRKKDFRDAERLLKRLVSQELTLSFVPNGEQRLWRTVTRTKYQLRRNKVRLHNQLESRSANWTRRSQVCSGSIRMQSSGWPKSPVSGWIRRNRSSPRWVPRQRPSPPPRTYPRGSGHARERKRARE